MHYRKDEFDWAAPVDIPGDLAKADILAPHLARFFRKPYTLKTPEEIVNAHRRSGYVVMPIPLSEEAGGGYMVFCINYDAMPMTVHPVGLYNGSGIPCRFSTRGLVSDPAGRFPYMLDPIVPLRTRRDVIDRSQEWTRRHVDTVPNPFSPY